MEFLLILLIAAVIIGGVAWGRKRFRPEIERARRIRRSNRGE